MQVSMHGVFKCSGSPGVSSVGISFSSEATGFTDVRRFWVRQTQRRHAAAFNAPDSAALEVRNLLEARLKGS